ncbi:hypothetical protein BDK51DRAFT_31591, partial [Blyttiomyces helicus]
PFPRRVFTPVDYRLSVAAAGLCPRSSLTVVLTQPLPEAPQAAHPPQPVAQQAPPQHAIALAPVPRLGNLLTRAPPPHFHARPRPVPRNAGYRLGDGSTPDPPPPTLLPPTPQPSLLPPPPDNDIDNDGDEDANDPSSDEDDEGAQGMDIDHDEGEGMDTDEDDEDDGGDEDHGGNRHAPAIDIGGGRTLADMVIDTNAGEAPAQIAQDATQRERGRETVSGGSGSPKHGSSGKGRKPLKTLRDACLDAVAVLIADPAVSVLRLRPLRSYNAKLAESVVDQLMRSKHLDRATLFRMKACPIENLNLDSYGLATDSLLDNVTLFRSSLVSLSLKGCDYLTDSGIERIAGEIWAFESGRGRVGIGLTHLQILDVSSCRLTDRIGSAFSGLENLETLNMSRTKVSQAIGRRLPSGLWEVSVAFCPNVTGDSVFVAFESLLDLRTFNLTGTALTSPQRSPSPRAFRSLEVLELAKTAIADDDIRRIVLWAPELRRLDLEGCRGVGRPGLIAIGKNLKKLQRLKLPHKELPIDEILPSFTDLPLEELDLAGFVLLTDAGVSHIARLKDTLTVLSLGMTHITDEGMRAVG